MSLVVTIIGVIYIAAMAVMGGLWRGVLRQQPSPAESRVPPTNIIPFRNPSVRSAGGETAES